MKNQLVKTQSEPIDDYYVMAINSSNLTDQISFELSLKISYQFIRNFSNESDNEKQSVRLVSFAYDTDIRNLFPEGLPEMNK